MRNIISYELSKKIAKRRKEERMQRINAWVELLCPFGVALTLLVCMFLWFSA